MKIRRLFGSVPVSASVPVGADARRMLRARQSIGYSVVRQCQIKVKHRFYICQNGLLKFCRINDKNPDKIGVFTGCIYFAALLCLWDTKKMDCIFDRWIRTPEEIHAPILQVKDALSGNSFAAFAHKYSAQK